MADSFIPLRPPTPQVLLHRLPDKLDDGETTRKPSKYIILIMGSTATAGKVQIARSVASALSCPLFQGDSLHESSAKAASVGTSRPAAAEISIAGDSSASSGPNEARYQRMWLSKLTRTGLLFPEESRPATEGFSGFGGTSSTSTSRRGSASSVASVSSTAAPSSSIASSRGGSMSSLHPGHSVASGLPPDSSSYVHNPVFTVSEQERLRRTNPVLMVLTHPELEQWHKLAARNAVGEYGIGIVFVPLYREQGDGDDDDEGELPVLRPLDPTMKSSFPTSFDAFPIRTISEASLDREMKIRIDVDADVDGVTLEIVEKVKALMDVEE